MKEKILIVDDEPDIVEMVSMRLSANGYDVLTALNGEEALRKAQKHKPALIVLDVMMPHLDGSIVAERLKDDVRTKNIPVIFLTCMVKPEEVQGRGIIGNNVFIAKPFDAPELLEKIAEILEG